LQIFQGVSNPPPGPPGRTEKGGLGRFIGKAWRISIMPILQPFDDRSSPERRDGRKGWQSLALFRLRAAPAFPAGAILAGKFQGKKHLLIPANLLIF
jgi:hypothetical protein